MRGTVAWQRYSARFPFGNDSQDPSCPHSVCLYIQNLAFEKHTAFLLNQLSRGASRTEEQLAGIRSLSSQTLETAGTVHQSILVAENRLKELQTGQDEAARAMHAAQQEAGARFEQLHSNQRRSLELQAESMADQQKLARGQEALLSELHTRHRSLEALLGGVETRARQVAALQQAAARAQHTLLQDMRLVCGAILGKYGLAHRIVLFLGSFKF